MIYYNFNFRNEVKSISGTTVRLKIAIFSFQTVTFITLKFFDNDILRKSSKCN